MREDHSRRSLLTADGRCMTKSGVIAGRPCRLNPAYIPAMTDHACAWAAASPARYRASSSAKAASTSSRSNATYRRDPLVVGVALGDDCRNSTCERPRVARVAMRDNRTWVTASRPPRVAMTVEVAIVTPCRARRMSVDDKRCDHVSIPASTTGRRSSTVTGRRTQLRRYRVPLAGREAGEASARTARLAVFSSRGVGGCSSSKRASAASRSASSKISQRLIRSPSTVRSWIIRHSASKPSGEVPYAAWVTTAPKLLSRCTASMWMLRSGVTSQTSAY